MWEWECGMSLTQGPRCLRPLATFNLQPDHRGRKPSDLSAPPSRRPHSRPSRRAVRVLSGQIALDPATGELDPEEHHRRDHRVMRNIGLLLEAAGLGEHWVKCTIFLSSMDHYAAVNEVYATTSQDRRARPWPCRTLPRNVDVEISATPIAADQRRFTSSCSDTPAPAPTGAWTSSSAAPSTQGFTLPGS